MLYEYVCPEHGVFTDHAKMKARRTPHACPRCGEPSYFQISAPRIRLEGISGDFPTAADRWARIHETGHRRSDNS